MTFALVGAFNQEKALVGAFSVIVKTDCETDGSFSALGITDLGSAHRCSPATFLSAVFTPHQAQDCRSLFKMLFGQTRKQAGGVRR